MCSACGNAGLGPPGLVMRPASLDTPPVLRALTTLWTVCEAGCVSGSGVGWSVCRSVPLLLLRKPPPFSTSAILASTCLLLRAGHPHCLLSSLGANLCPEHPTRSPGPEVPPTTVPPSSPSRGLCRQAPWWTGLPLGQAWGRGETDGDTGERPSGQVAHVWKLLWATGLT